MDDFFRESLYAGVVLSLGTYGLGLVLKRRLKLGVFNPLLVSIALTIAVLASCGVSYEAYASGARYLSWLLTPATVCLAIPLYEKREALVRNARAILLALTAGAVTGGLTVLALAALLRLDHCLYVTLLPKSITTAIGMGIAEELDGHVTIAVAVIVVTGVLGNVLGVALCRLFRIRHPVAKGLAFGASSHAIGTTKAMELGEVEGAMSGLAIAVSGVITVIIAPLFARLF